MSKKRINKDKVIDDLLLLIAKKNKRIIELEQAINHLEEKYKDVCKYGTGNE